MKEQSEPNGQGSQGEIHRITIFDKHGYPIGVAVNDGSLDYAPQPKTDKTSVVIQFIGGENKIICEN